MDFIYQALPSRIIFGAGKIENVVAEVDLLNIKRALVLSTPQQRNLAEEIVYRLGNNAVGIYDQAVMHVPVQTVHDAMNVVTELNIDGCIAIGGGSTIGLAKAIALKTDLPILAIPTTYAGSEMTPIWGLTENGVKTTGRDLKVLPKTVIYDPELTIHLPSYISGPSGMNAIAHCVEALYAQNKNPIVSLMAEEGICALQESLPIIIKKPTNLIARTQALYGAWLSGSALGSVGMAIHHKLCHTLGGVFNLPHAEVHAIIIPQATDFNKHDAPQAMVAIARALGVHTEEAATGLFDLAASIGAPTALKDIGMQEQDLDKAAEITTMNPYYNPRPIDQESVRALLENAFWGIRPKIEG